MMTEFLIVSLVSLIVVSLMVILACLRVAGECDEEERRRADATRSRKLFERQSVETALQIKLLDWQVEYIWYEGPQVKGRATGKTLAYCIKLCLSDGEPLHMYPGGKHSGLCDEYHGPQYPRLFREYVREVYPKLQKQKGLKLRTIYFSQKEVSHYETMV